MRTAVLLAFCCLLGIGATPARAQDSSPSRITWGEIFDADEAWTIGAVAAGTTALERVDSILMVRAQDSTAFERSVLDPIATRLSLLGRPGSFALAGGALVLGAALGNREMSDIGLHTGTALLINEVATRAVKGLVGRARPNVSRRPLDFAFGGGFGQHDRGSFPSGHASSTFAAAAVLQGELAHRGSRYRLPVAVLTYATAGAIGLSRIYDNDHWATDVLAGAALGYLIGENVVEYAHYADDQPSAGGDVPQAARAGSPGPDIPLFILSIPTR